MLAGSAALRCRQGFFLAHLCLCRQQNLNSCIFCTANAFFITLKVNANAPLFYCRYSVFISCIYFSANIISKLNGSPYGISELMIKGLSV